MTTLEETVKEALDGLEVLEDLENLGVPRELWPMVVAALIEARFS